MLQIGILFNLEEAKSFFSDQITNDDKLKEDENLKCAKKINTIEEFSAFMDDNIYEIVDTEKICDKFTWFTTKENHKRIYGIAIEFLIGIYLYSTTSTFYTKLYPFYWLS